MRPLPSLALALVAVLVAAGVLLADRLVQDVVPTSAEASTRQVEPVAGLWACPVGDGRAGTDLTVTVARPSGASDAPAQVEIATLADGERSAVTSRRLFAESAVTEQIPGGRSSAATVAWRDAPTVVHREWVTGQGDDLPPGIVAGGCVQPFADAWVVPGMDTSGGAQAILRFANPFTTDATIAIGFVAPDGPLQPLALRNLSVEGRGTLEVDVNEFLPERQDLAAIVTVVSGRVGVEGYQLARSAIGGIDGVSRLAAASEASETWTVPWVVDGEGRASWLWAYNPGDRQALVELTYHTEDGGTMPAGLAEVIVEPGQLRRIDLRGTLPAGTDAVAVTARSDGAPVVVSGAAQLEGDEVSRSGLAIQLGASASDSSWTVSGGGAAERTEHLHVVNPGGVQATASIAIFNGVSVLRPPELQGMTVPPGARRVVEISEELGGADRWTAFVTATSGEVVVGRVGGDDAGARRLVAGAGIPSLAWQATSPGITVAREDGLVRRFATSLGIARGEQGLPAPVAPGLGEPPVDGEDLAPGDDLAPDDESAPGEREGDGG